jgi:hypothetical protein
MRHKTRSNHMPVSVINAVVGFFGKFTISTDDGHESNSSSLLFTGVTKPTTTLAHMLVAEILKSDESPTKTADLHVLRLKSGKISWSVVSDQFTLPSGKVLSKRSVAEACKQYSLDRGFTDSYWQPHEISGKSDLRKYVERVCKRSGLPKTTISDVRTSLPVVFDKAELKILEDGLVQYLRQDEEREKNLEFTKNQESAVAVIADFMGVSSETNEIPEGPFSR